MPRWLPTLALCFALGILAQDVAEVPHTWWRGLCVAALLVGARSPRGTRPGSGGARSAHRASRARRAGWQRGLAAAIACFASGGGLLARELERAARHVPHGPRDVVVEARVCSAVSGPAHYASVDLCEVALVSTSALAAPVPERLRVSGSAEDGSDAALRSLRRGARVRLGLRVRPAVGSANPGLARGERVLARRGIGARGRLRHPDLRVELLDARRPARRPWRAHTARALAERGEGGALLAALALGESAMVSAARRSEFARLGIAHVLAVSGLHLALVAGLAFAATLALFRLALALPTSLSVELAGRDGRGGALVVGVGAALGYAILSGGRAPVQRAAVLLVLAWAARHLGRGRSFAPALAAAALVVLALDPGALFRVGPQLSFAACCGLMAAMPPSRAQRGVSAAGTPGGLARALEGLSATARAGAAASAATAPVLAAHGLVVTPLGVATNLVAIPWTAFVLLPAAFAATACELAACSTGVELASALGEATLAAARSLAAALPAGAPAATGLPRPALWALALAAAGAVAAVRARATGARVALAVAVCLWCTVAPRPVLGPAPPRLVAFDVGLGDAVLVQGREAALLVDAGLARAPGPDRGARVVVPALAALGVRRLDVVVASHADLDHRGGLEAVLAHLPVGELWLPRGGVGDPDFSALVARARARGVRVRARARGGPDERVGDLAVEVLWPPRGATPALSRNDQSLVLRVAVEGGPRVLLTGDAGLSVERELLGSGRLDADVLKVGHHGSATASGAAFLEAVDPTVALLSAGCPRRGLPSPAVWARLRARSGALWWTARDGALWVRLVSPLAAWGERRRPSPCGRPPD